MIHLPATLLRESPFPRRQVKRLFSYSNRICRHPNGRNPSSPPGFEGKSRFLPLVTNHVGWEWNPDVDFEIFQQVEVGLNPSIDFEY
jgi:hypothetical protein